MRVLVAVDGSPASGVVVDEIVRRPWPPYSEFEVLAVAHASGPMLPDPALVMAAVHVVRTRELAEQAEGWVHAAADRIRHGVPASRVSTVVREGEPKDVIVHQAGASGADLIVLGCHGYGPVRRALLGSVATAVALHAPCSVEIVRAKQAAA